MADQPTSAAAESVSNISYADYEYPFENLVFEGGGAKGQVYVGCLQVLEEIGIKPKRIAGTSAGAMFAALLAAGYNSEGVARMLEEDMDKLFLDHSCGICSFLPNLIRNFGWNPGKKFTDHFGSLLAEKLGNPDVTFKQLHKATGVELCVTAVNMNTVSVEYFHVKTTPNMPVRLAVRMSLSIPGIFEAVRVPNARGQTDVYIDGGLLCNYPIHAFDGWWLSLKNEDSFLNRLQPLTEVHRLLDKGVRFGEFNQKTLGFMVYSALEQDLLKNELEDRLGVEDIQRPADSDLYKSRSHMLDIKKQVNDDFEVFLKSMEKFTLVLKEVNKRANGEEEDDVIDKEELKRALRGAIQGKKVNGNDAADPHSNGGGDAVEVNGDDKKSTEMTQKTTEFAETEALTSADIEILFGPNSDVDTIFDQLDVDNNGVISYVELVMFVERSGVDIQDKFNHLHRVDVSNIRQYVDGLQNCLLTNIQRLFLEHRDVDRTVGINTDYIETTDFKMEPVDREFCNQQGRNSLVSFLRHYVQKNKPNRKVHSADPMSEVKLPQSTPRSPDINESSKAESPLLAEK